MTFKAYLAIVVIIAIAAFAFFHKKQASLISGNFIPFQNAQRDILTSYGNDLHGYTHDSVYVRGYGWLHSISEKLWDICPITLYIPTDTSLELLDAINENLLNKDSLGIFFRPK